MPKSASNEREKSPPPKHRPIFAVPALPTSTAHFATLAKPNLPWVVLLAKARHTEFAVFALLCHWILLCCAVSLSNSPRHAVLCVVEFSAPCCAPLRPKNTLCHAPPHAKFLPHAQGASTATLKGVALRWHKAFAKFAFKGLAFLNFLKLICRL